MNRFRSSLSALFGKVPEANGKREKLDGAAERQYTEATFDLYDISPGMTVLQEKQAFAAIHRALCDFKAEHGRSLATQVWDFSNQTGLNASIRREREGVEAALRRSGVPGIWA